MLKGIKKLISGLVFVLCFSQTVHAAVLLDRVVAVVNKEVITWSELYKMMESEASEQTKALNEDDRRKVFKENEAIFLDKLIDLRLQMQEAGKLGIAVSPEDVKDAIENIKKKYSMTDQSLEESLKKEGFTMEEYKKRLSEQILMSQFINQQIKGKVVVSDEDIRKFMQTHKEDVGGEEAFKLRQIYFKNPRDDAGKKALEEKVSLIMQRLKAGEDFSTLAKEYSEDPSGKIGGDTGYIKRNYLAKEFIDAISGMKAGEVSKPFRTDRGFHIIKLDERLSAQSANEIKDSVKRQLVDAQFLEKYNSYVKGLREKARIEIRL